MSVPKELQGLMLMKKKVIFNIIREKLEKVDLDFGQLDMPSFEHFEQEIKHPFVDETDRFCVDPFDYYEDSITEEYVKELLEVVKKYET